MTLEEAKSLYVDAKSAYQAALKAQSISKGSRSISYQQLEVLKQEMLYWERQVDELSKSDRPTSGVKVIYAKFN